MPGRDFHSPTDFNAQLEDWLPKANHRYSRSRHGRPDELIVLDRERMRELQPSAQETATLVDDLLDVSQKHMDTLREAGATGVIHDVAGSLLASPIVTKARLAKKFGKNYQTISNAVVKLQQIGILEEYLSRLRRTHTSPRTFLPS